MSATRSAPVFAINHMVTPALRPQAFFELARAIGVRDVEIRNDLTGNAIIDGTPAADIGAQAAAAGVKIATINALQRFNEWTPEREKEAIELADYARDAGAAALVLVPVNDGTGQEDGARQANLRAALTALKPILTARGLFGFVEPLGFEICSLRSKREAVEAIEAVGGEDTFRIVHDTFHHHLAGEPALFPQWTGLVHISGVTDAAVSLSDMRDSHRVLVDGQDRLGNTAQIRALLAGGYAGVFSFEPFAEEVQQHDDPAGALSQSIALIKSQLA
ncbi:TIM barrel protein [Phyllobacterium myrsinacearum]|uniref:Xylose isomerase n=1 Tax=Phyllobacterium myrsinacearum TaxID=28101 RepID=A0A2S9JWI8_9HYPH|nr:TIM barrel protein [Phyllobacterium myrsinacearum]PRD57698.1 xylose isomerase [Phyllobacterium myrsinacearum]PWV88475.1 2-keto-myo-inositol isomerase [Phyllobacterium myrsinacearum]RZV10159.1 2-keto-myo-inositol isomerase [Phyllobacterium myrsinacearum]